MRVSLSARSSVFCQLLCCLAATGSIAQTDPGPRAGAAGAGGALPGLSLPEVAVFNAARAVFGEVDSVAGGVAGEEGSGLGPTFNANSCAACHAQPNVGGSSPHPTLGQARVPNPQVALATVDRLPGRNQVVPSFIHADGPVREARFIRNSDGSADGGVHGLYTIAGRVDAPAACNLAQPDFAHQLANGNVIFRIPTPTFGLGLIEAVSDAALAANLNNTALPRLFHGIRGRFNTNGNDGTITRFGWKAQNKSLLIFSGEAYNVEQGVSNEVFPNERDNNSGCATNAIPEDVTHVLNPDTSGTTGTTTQMGSDVTSFALFMRMSAPPTPTTSTTSQSNGAALFSSVGCALCHSATLTTDKSRMTGQSNVSFHPYSDVALHQMGPGLADFIGQGGAGPDEFRSAPLWGVGQRVFFLHDGRAGPANGGLQTAILAHASSDQSLFCLIFGGNRIDGVACNSEANIVISTYRSLSASHQQDILNFLRSL